MITVMGDENRKHLDNGEIVRKANVVYCYGIIASNVMIFVLGFNENPFT
jgi:hypothetical protein